MKFNPNYFPKYNQLSSFEKLILKTCCYFPPKQPRKREELVINPEKYTSTLSKAYGNDFWELIKGKKVLDFGCGEGGFVIAMASKGNSDVEGVDIYDDFDVAKEYISQNGVLNTKFHVGMSSVLEDASYDVIISHDSFEHFEDPAYILKEMSRLLKPEGHLLIKFGPTWMGPYGRHMSGTYKKSRPWIHLLFSERSMMRIHSVYHNKKELKTLYKDLKGGLNKMTIAKAARIIKSNSSLKIEKRMIAPWRGMKFFVKIPLLKELFASGVTFKIVKTVDS